VRYLPFYVTLCFISIRIISIATPDPGAPEMSTVGASGRTARGLALQKYLAGEFPWGDGSTLRADSILFCYRRRGLSWRYSRF